MDFGGFALYAIDFRDADLTNVDFTGADLRGTIFLRTTISGTDFTEALMPGLSQPQGGPSAVPTYGTPAVMPDGYRLIRSGFWGPFVAGPRLDFTGEDFSGLTLVGTGPWHNHILDGASMVDADLRGLDLYRAAPMTDTNLFGAAGTNITPGGLTNVTCPNGGNSDFNGSTCAGLELLPGYVIRRAEYTPFHGQTLITGLTFTNPWLFHSDGPAILEGPTAGVDWYLDGLLYRDQDFTAPFDFSNSLSELPLYTSFNGEGPAGSGNSFLPDPGLHEVSAIATHATGTTEYTALFYVPTP
ncbi:MAG: pentapeptide repeat-containing protein [Acidimicrobiales bacterium]|nr:pentapeptide repeat-containing protein [Acidimicrobiales bacterium]